VTISSVSTFKANRAPLIALTPSGPGLLLISAPGKALSLFAPASYPPQTISTTGVAQEIQSGAWEIFDGENIWFYLFSRSHFFQARFLRATRSGG
jgi:hypothetical protein